jgi:uncharacterized membrane protein
MSIYLRAVLFGLATGGRSTVGITALALTAPRTGSWLGNRWLTRAAGLASAGELAGDKLPKAPSRLAPPGLVSRLAFGVIGGMLLARRYRASTTTTVLAGLLAVAAAVVGALLGGRWRSLVARRLGTDLPGALAEDAGWLAVARYAVTAR